MSIKVDWSIYTEKQRACIAGYIKHGNKLKAYREAYNVTEQTPNTTKRQCQKFFNRPKIVAIIDQIQVEALSIANLKIDSFIQESIDDLVELKKQEINLYIDASWVLHRTALLADFNLHKFIKTDNAGNAVYDFSSATEDDWYCISEYTVEEIAKGQGDDKYFVDKLKLKSYDKLRALELVGKHVDIQAFRDNIGLSSPDGGAIEVADMSDEVLKVKLLELGISDKVLHQLDGKRVK